MKAACGCGDVRRTIGTRSLCQAAELFQALDSGLLYPIAVDRVIEACWVDLHALPRIHTFAVIEIENRPSKSVEDESLVSAVPVERESQIHPVFPGG